MRKVNQVVLDEDDLGQLTDILECIQDAIDLDSYEIFQPKMLELLKFCQEILR